MDFLTVYDQYYAGVRKFILAIVRDEWVADDLVQETFIRIGENLSNLRDPSNMSPWVFRIAHNLCQDHFRSLKRPSSDGRMLEEQGEPCKGSLIQREVEQRQMGECVQNYVNLLPEPQRTVLILFDVMEFDHREIAQILDIRVENVKVRLHRARKKLRGILEEKCTFQMDERNVLVCEPCDRKTNEEGTEHQLSETKRGRKRRDRNG